MRVHDAGINATRRPSWRKSAPVQGLVVLALVVGACSSPKSATGGTPAPKATAKVAQNGGPGEGPYPWKYPASGTNAPGSGTTVSGIACSPGTPQFPSPYAPPCLPKFSGDNGGATYNGVTATQILLANRVFPTTANSEATAAAAKQAGAALPQVTDQIEQTFLNYFNKVYELYGRQVVLKNVTATSNSTLELLNQGQAQACADADTMANQLHAFGDAGIAVNLVGSGSGPFSQCAAQRKLVEFSGDAYYDETTYQQLNPYVWNIAQDCERISTQGAEVGAKLLVGKPAIYAGDAALKSKVRKFGTYVPNVPAYQHCGTLYTDLLTNQYHVPADQVNTVFKYGLDISTFQQSAQQAIIQFKAQGVTTVVLSCDPYSAAVLTKAAAAQNYHPEWYINGAATNDLDMVGQSYDQGEVTGHLFGLSELSPSKEVTGPDSLAGKLYQQLTGHPIPPGTDGNYGPLVSIFNSLQAAGPDLTPDNLARGLHAVPALGAPDFQYGSWNYAIGPSGQPGSGDHTAVADARLVYWDGKATSPVNQKQGTYVEVFPGKRFANGTWPATMPPLFANG
jgi:hypothetical protein